MGARWRYGVHTWLAGSSVAGQLCGEGEGAAAAASRVWTKYTCSPHTCCLSATGPMASSVNQQPEAVRETQPPPCRAAWLPQPWGLRSLGRHWRGGREGAGFCSGRWWGAGSSS